MIENWKWSWRRPSDPNRYGKDRAKLERNPEIGNESFRILKQCSKTTSRILKGSHKTDEEWSKMGNDPEDVLQTQKNPERVPANGNEYFNNLQNPSESLQDRNEWLIPIGGKILRECWEEKEGRTGFGNQNLRENGRRDANERRRRVAEPHRFQPRPLRALRTGGAVTCEPILGQD